MGRMTKQQHFERYVPQRKPKKITRLEAQRLLNSVFKRAAVAQGLIDPTKGKFRWQWHFDGRSGDIEANNRSEARGKVKKVLGIPKKDRLPIGVAILKVGVTEGRDIPFVSVIEKRKAADAA
jgi:hypothetical protein